MKYYSETTKQMYNTAEDCMKAENAFNAEKAAAEAKAREAALEKQHRIEELNAAKAELKKAEEKYGRLLKAFERDYGPNTLKEKEEVVALMDALFSGALRM